MTDIERARKYAAKIFDARARKYPRSATMERHHAKVIRQGEGDEYDATQSALLAIQSERERAKGLVATLKDIAWQHVGSEMSSDEESAADYQGAYEIIVNMACKALAELEAGND